MTIDKDALLASRLPEEEFEIEGVGTVRIRSLTRAEALAVRGRELPTDEVERVLLEAALVEPKLTKGEIRLWQEAAPAGELEPLTRAIMRLSGLEDSSAKEAVKRFRE